MLQSMIHAIPAIGGSGSGSGLTDWPTTVSNLSTVYVNESSGTDAADKGTGTGSAAFATLGYAVREILKYICTAETKIVVESNLTSWPDTIYCPLGCNTLTVEGDTTTPSNRVIEPATNPILNVSGALALKGFQISPDAGTWLIYIAAGDIILSDILFKPALASQRAMQISGYGSSTTILSATHENYAIALDSSGAGSFSYICLASGPGHTLLKSGDMEFVGSPVFSNYLWRARYGAAIIGGSGAVTGTYTGTNYVDTGGQLGLRSILGGTSTTLASDGLQSF